MIKLLNKAIKLCTNKEKYLICNINKDKHKIPYKDIYYIESNKKLVTVHFQKESLSFYHTLTELDNQLKNYGFYRISKSYIVNEQYVKSLEGMKITLRNSVEITAGSKYVDRLFDLIGIGE